MSELDSTTIDVDYLANPLLGSDKIPEPAKWQTAILSGLGVPNTLPAAALPSTTIDTSALRLSEGSSRSAKQTLYLTRFITSNNIGRKGTGRKFEILRDLLVHTCGWLAEYKDIEVISESVYRLQLGEWYQEIPVQGKLCLDSPFLSYTDARFRHQCRTDYDIWDDHESLQFKFKFDEHALDPYDLAILIAMAQEQKFYDLPPKDGRYTTRIMYPNQLFTEMIVVTATIPHETLVGMECGEEKLKRMSFTRGSISLEFVDKLEQWPFLQMMVALTEEGMAQQEPEEGCVSNEGAV